MARIKPLRSEKIFNNITFVTLSIYVIFAAVMIGSVLFYTSPGFVLKYIISKETLFSIRLSMTTSLITTALALLVGVPAGYCLSRYNFRGKGFVDMIIDLPIVLPPLVMGLCILIFFSLAPGRFVQDHIMRFVFSVPGIVLAQFSISASFAVIALRSAFDGVDPRYEQAARTLGCNKVQAFFKTTFPLVSGGMISGAVMVWTRAVGEFVPILLICGATKGKTDIMPIAIFLEFEQGNVEGAVSLTIIFLLLASIYLATFRKLGLRTGGRMRER